MTDRLVSVGDDFVLPIEIRTGLAETIQDVVNTMVVAGANVTKTYDDTAGTLTIAATGGSNVDVEAVRDTIGAALTAGTGIAVTVNDAGDTITIAVSGIPASAITTGVIAPARLGTGTASGTTYLRGDGTWATVAGGSATTDASQLTSGILPIARIADGSVTAAKVAADVATQAELDVKLSGAVDGAGNLNVTGGGVDVTIPLADGVPEGGTTGQALLKTGNGDYQVGWGSPSSSATNVTVDGVHVDTLAVAGDVVTAADLGAISSTEKGAANGVATLNSSTRIPLAQLGSGTPAAGKYIDGASGAWTTFPAAGTSVAPGRVKTPVGGAVLSIPGADITAVATGTATNVTRYEPILVQGQAITVDALAIEVSAVGTTTGFTRMAVYGASKDWQPTSLINDFGDIDLASTGLRYATTGGPIVLAPGRYLLACHSTSNSTCRTFATPGPQLGYSAAGGTTGFLRALATTVTEAGAFPSTPANFPEPSFGALGFQRFMLVRITDLAA